MSDARSTVADWMTEQPHTIGYDQPLTQARKRMLHLQVRHLPVLHGGNLVGVVSERDIALVESLPGVDMDTVTVDEAMTQDPYTAPADASLNQVSIDMAERRIGAAIVVEGRDRRVVGVFTTTDALRALANFCA